MKQDVILVLDCGATNVRVIAVNRQGKIVARAATANASEIAVENSAWHQWSLEAILQRFADCSRKLTAELLILPDSGSDGDDLRRGRCAG